MSRCDSRAVLIVVVALLISLPAGCGPMKPAAEPRPDPVAALAPNPEYRDARPEPYSWSLEPTLVAHGLGGISGERVTNSLEAFQANYDAGYRVFEIDLILSADERLVARHDWMAYMYDFLGQKVENPYAKMTEAQFKALPIHEVMTPLTVDDLLAIMRAYPDVWVVTDTKSKDPLEVRTAFTRLREAIGEDTVLADRLIVQIYNEAMLDEVLAAYPFKNLAYTLYQLEGTVDDAIAFAASRGVKVLVISEERWTPGLVEKANDAGLVAAVHTVNDAEKVARYLDSGVTVIYSDFLQPADLRAPE